MSAAGGGSAALTIPQILNMSVAQLKMELDRAGVTYVASSSKPALQQKLKSFMENKMPGARMAEIQQSQQRQEAVVLDEDMEYLEVCSICYEQFSDGTIGEPGMVPRNLMCSHTFCTGCLRDMYRKTDKPIPNNIRCPNCNKDTPFPVPNQVDVETDFVSQHLPKNYLLCQVGDCLHYSTNLIH